MKPLSAACLTVPLYILSTLDACQCYSYQTEPLFLSFSELAALEASSSDPSETPASPDGIQTFVLTCQEDSMEVLIRAHLLDPSLALEPHRFWLGPPSSRGRHCSAQASGDGGYIIRAPLGGCGSTVTVVYPEVFAVRQPAAVFTASSFRSSSWDSSPVRYRVSSRTLEPAWGPVFPVQSAPPALNFHLKLMTGDWSRERKSSVYFLGETVNIEASVDHPPLPLRLYADSCEAALTSAAHSTRRHVFIDQHGCLTDSQLHGSSSRFLPRIQDHLLRFQLTPLLFHQDHRTTMFISCHLEAVPVSDEEPIKRACSFVNGSWRSADGDRRLCESCSSTFGSDHRRALKSDSGRSTLELHHETRLRPVIVLTDSWLNTQTTAST